MDIIICVQLYYMVLEGSYAFFYAPIDFEWAYYMIDIVYFGLCSQAYKYSIRFYKTMY